MSRIIKFRGLSLNGEWYYGNLSVLKTDKHIVPAGHYISNKVGMPFAYGVRPETVGQFTGLFDKNKKEIWEGDIVIASWMHHGKPGSPFRAFIFYNEHIGSFRIGYDSLGGGSQDEIYFRYQVEVIGNRYEHKELITKG